MTPDVLRNADSGQVYEQHPLNIFNDLFMRALFKLEVFSISLSVSEPVAST